MSNTHTPGKDLLVQARIEFLKKGTSLSRWCLDNDIDRAYVHRAVVGTLTTPGAEKLRERVLIAAGLLPAPVTRKRKQA